MKTLREFRKESKISQTIMADMLKITRSQVNMAERGLRSLPPHAMERLQKMQETAARAVKLPIENDLAMIESDQLMAFEAKEIWEGMLKENEYQLYTQRIRLTKMQQKFDTVLTKSKAFSQAVETLPGAGGKPPEINYMNSLQTQTQHKLLPHGKTAQLRLQLRIDLLLAEARLLKQYLDPATTSYVADIIARNTPISNDR